MAALYPAKEHPNRILSLSNFRDVPESKGMLFPITFADIRIFEKKIVA